MSPPTGMIWPDLRPAAIQLLPPVLWSPWYLTALSALWASKGIALALGYVLNAARAPIAVPYPASEGVIPSCGPNGAFDA